MSEGLTTTNIMGQRSTIISSKNKIFLVLLLASFLLAALSSVLKLKGIDALGD